MQILLVNVNAQKSTISKLLTNLFCTNIPLYVNLDYTLQPLLHGTRKGWQAQCWYKNGDPIFNGATHTCIMPLFFFSKLVSGSYHFKINVLFV